MPTVVTFSVNLYSIGVWVFVGLVAGLLASWVMLGHGMGVAADIIVGIIGAILGNIVASYLGIVVTWPGHPIASLILVAFIGAMILLMFIRVGVRHRRRAAI